MLMGRFFCGGGKARLLMRNLCSATHCCHAREGGHPAFRLSAGSPPEPVIGPRLARTRWRGRQVVIHRPYSLCGPGQAVFFAPLPGPFFRPLDRSRGWSTEWRTSLQSCRAPLRGTRAPPGAPSAAFLSPGPYLPGARRRTFALPIRQASARLRPHRVQPSKAAGRRAGGRLPEASREQGYEPRPQAPHPTPLSERLMTTPSSGWDGDKVYRPRD